MLTGEQILNNSFLCCILHFGWFLSIWILCDDTYHTVPSS